MASSHGMAGGQQPEREVDEVVVWSQDGTSGPVQVHFPNHADLTTLVKS